MNTPLSGPQAFEQLVAADFRTRGYTVQVSGGSGDWGVDVFATKGAEKLAIQAKMYGGARPVNRRQVFELYGASRYFGCSGAVLATDGEVAPDALEAAQVLGVSIWRPTTDVARITLKRATTSAVDIPRRGSSSLPTFEQVWSNSVVPLVGETLPLENGGSNRIVKVDWSGIERVTSTGRRGRIPIEPFMWAVARIREHGQVTRAEVNDEFEGRYSSGVALILAQVPELIVASGVIRIRDGRADESEISDG